MYNKLFTKILDSSIWLEPSPTRIVWMTLIAAMDESGFALFASPANLAHRARVTLDECNAAVTVLESEDANSADPEHGGRRIERVPGGWMVLNASKYRDLVTRATIQEQTRLRVARYRERHRKGNADVTPGNETVTPSDTDTEASLSRTRGARRRPTLAQAKTAAANIGVTEAEADEWWNAREASDWFKGTAGGGKLEVGDNWQADLKSYTNNARNRKAERNGLNRKDHRNDSANKPGRYN